MIAWGSADIRDPVEPTATEGTQRILAMGWAMALYFGHYVAVLSKVACYLHMGCFAVPVKLR
jgi:hypothetical protein